MNKVTKLRICWSVNFTQKGQLLLSKYFIMKRSQSGIWSMKCREHGYRCGEDMKNVCVRQIHEKTDEKKAWIVWILEN